MMHALGFVTSCECESPPRKDVAPHLGPVLEVHPFCDGLGGCWSVWVLGWWLSGVCLLVVAGLDLNFWLPGAIWT